MTGPQLWLRWPLIASLSCQPQSHTQTQNTHFVLLLILLLYYKPDLVKVHVPLSNYICSTQMIGSTSQFLSSLLSYTRWTALVSSNYVSDINEKGQCVELKPRTQFLDDIGFSLCHKVEIKNLWMKNLWTSRSLLNYIVLNRKVSKSEESLRWLIISINLILHGLNLTSHKIIYFTSHGVNSQSFSKNVTLTQQGISTSHQLIAEDSPFPFNDRKVNTWTQGEEIYHGSQRRKQNSVCPTS